jgi:hypothetical protein
MTLDYERTPHRPLRVLVTGSRDWADASMVAAALDQATDAGRTPSVVVHGACPTGADKMAAQWAEAQHDQPFDAPVQEEAYPADWSQGRKAGPVRNKMMVDRGADVCLAFISDCTSPRCSKPGPHPSHGASGCADMAERAGIPVYRYFPTTAGR